jgi:hypothetical protein
MSEDENVTITKREILTLKEDGYNLDKMDVTITQDPSTVGATIEFDNGLRVDSSDLIDLADLVKFLTKS